MDAPDASDDSRGPLSPPDEAFKGQPRKRRWALILSIGAAVIVVILALTLGLYFGLRKDNDKTDEDGAARNGDDPDGRDDLDDGPVVDLGYSQYKGRYLNNGISIFLGMRYGKAPVGDLRWRAPVAPESTRGTQSAQKFGATCPGMGQSIGDDYDEDCLFVNVWSPTDATPDSKLPVLVYFQPGGYLLNSAPFTNGTQLVDTSDRNMLFVTFNHRIGVYGFLASEEVKNDGDLNVGILDQRLLLEWVHDHISEFGGDPDHVVIHGQSSGAGSVALQLVAYGGRDDGLFAGAIAESLLIPSQPKYDALEYQFDRVVKEMECGDADDKMACLRGKSQTELQRANKRGSFEGRSDDAYFYWNPCTDGDLLRDYPSIMFESEDFVQVPILFGTCTNEGTRYPPDARTSDQFLSFMVDNYPDLSENETEVILDTYPREPRLPTRQAWFPSAARAYGEAAFVCPTINILDSFPEATNIWAYRYNVEIKDFVQKGLGVPHVSNGPAVFGPKMTPSASGPSYLTYNAPMVPIVMNYWISFVRALDPNEYRYKDTPRWEPWGSDQRRLKFELRNNTMERVTEGERERCDVWLGLANSTHT
ncbi:hypothetical protein ACJ41O_004443 [Fusarium nematophilum]